MLKRVSMFPGYLVKGWKERVGEREMGKDMESEKDSKREKDCRSKMSLAEFTT